MNVRPRFGRRSFLGCVTGGAIAGAVLMAFEDRARAQPVDNDVGKHADSAHGVTGITDRDTGANADPAGHIGRPRCWTGVTDHDNARTGDPIACGRGRRSGSRPSRSR